MKKITKIILILLGGIIGGILVEILFPYLANMQALNQIGFLRRAFNGTTIINPVQKFYIEENQARQDAIAKISPSLILVTAEKSPSTKKKVVLPKAVLSDGMILTSDGQIITSIDVVATGYDNFVLRQAQGKIEKIPAKLIKTSVTDGLALFKIEQSNLPVVSLADSDSLRLGQEIILAGLRQESATSTKVFVDNGILSYIGQNEIQTTINESAFSIVGTTLFNQKGEVVGINILAKTGKLSVVRSDKISDIFKK